MTAPCKADCLNWIVQAIFQQNTLQPEPFAGVILHDSEDVLHPLELKYYNYLLPRMDFIQLPVTSLEREWYELVAGTYMDEFAEWHTKDLVVRESMSHMVPSAGVGTCFSRKAMEELAAETHNQPFNTDTLTEDYDIGARLARRGMKQIFGKFPVDYVIRRKPLFGLGKEKVSTLTMPLGIREFFPNTFKTAYRQKARWTLGIGLQGWSQVGWAGPLSTKYLLFRDRKGLVTSFVAILAYLLLLNFLVFLLADHMGWWTVYYPPCSPQWLAGDADEHQRCRPAAARGAARLVRLAPVRLGARLAVRPAHGDRQLHQCHGSGARLEAVHRPPGHGQAPGLGQDHARLPSTDQLVHQRQRLGELLLSWQAIDETRLASALEIQRRERRPLGAILMEQGWLDEATLREAISFQQGSPPIPGTSRLGRNRQSKHTRGRHMKRLAPLVRPLTLAALLGAGWNAPPAWPQAAAAVKAEAPLRGAHGSWPTRPMPITRPAALRGPPAPPHRPYSCVPTCCACACC